MTDRWVRVLFHVTWRDYGAGEIYDVDLEKVSLEDLESLFATKLATHVPYQD